MCENRIDNFCKLNNNICPWAQWCGKLSIWKERDGSARYCKFLQETPIPEGYYKIIFEKHGFLYIQYKNETLKIKNPFDDIPKFVQVKKTKTSYKLTK